MISRAQTTEAQPQHHVDEDVLLAYAAGSLPEAASLVAAAHLTLCPHCRAVLRVAEAVGGMLLETITPQAVAPLSWDRLDVPEDEARETPVELALFGTMLPKVLEPYLPTRLDALRWGFVQPGITYTELFKDASGARVGLMRARPGAVITPHGHSGDEIALVLDGGYRDGSLLFRRGDVQGADENLTHAPAAEDDDGCLLLLLTSGPIRPTRLIAKILRPFTGF